MISFLQILTFLGMAALVLLAKHYLPTYITEKGKNLATKEDIGEITKEIEKVKYSYAHELETIRASLGSRGHIYQIRYKHEFEILLKLCELLVEFRDATISLRPAADIINKDESEEDRKKRRLNRYSEASLAIYTFSAYSSPNRPGILI
jgi:hypothetical protein